jgi:hypothetical protein
LKSSLLVYVLKTVKRVARQKIGIIFRGREDCVEVSPVVGDGSRKGKGKGGGGRLGFFFVEGVWVSDVEDMAIDSNLQTVRGRLEGGRREAGGRPKGGQREAGGRLEGEKTERSEEGGRRPEGGD